MIVILMGVTGSGKSVVAAELVRLTGWKLAEADDYHSEANKKKMHSGIPLNDQDRAPWLASLHNVILEWVRAGESGVMTCSALKQAYRDVLTAGIPDAAYRLVLLDAPFAVLEQRLRNRKEHFMNPDLLQSQLDTMEQPANAIRVQATAPAESVARNILNQLTPA